MQGNSSCNNNVNELAIPKISDPFAREYDMNHKYRGKAYIFHHKLYLKDNIDERDGNDVDVARLTKELKELDFKVKPYNDFTAAAIRRELRTVAAEDHTDADCLVVAVMSHGNEAKEDGNKDEDEEEEEEEEEKDRKRKRKAFSLKEKHKILAFDTSYEETDLFEPFIGRNCLTLQGKPKIFFIQACRGTEKQKRNPVRYQSDGSLDNAFCLYWVPDTADFLIVRSTVNGTVSFRNRKEGTLFIKILCDVLQENRLRANVDDLNTLLSFVSGRVAVAEIGKTPKNWGQMPFVMSTLTKLVYFRPKSKNSVSEKIVDNNEEDSDDMND